MAVALITLVVVGMAIWGFVAPALDLRREGRLRGRLLLRTYRRQVGQTPRAFSIALKITFRHPWPFGGPVHAWVLLIPFLLMSSLTVVFSDLFCDCGESVLLIPLSLVVWTGWGLVLVRDVGRYAEEDCESPGGSSQRWNS